MSFTLSSNTLNLIKNCSKLCYTTHKQSNSKYNINRFNNNLTIVSFPGTRSGYKDWVYNLDIRENNSGFHTGFQYKYDKIKEHLHEQLKNCDTPLVFTGYSSGAAVATLASLEYFPKSKHCVIFGSPNFCIQDFSDKFMELLPQSYNVTLQGDPVVYAGSAYYSIGHHISLDSNGTFVYKDYPRTSIYTDEMTINQHCITSYNEVIEGL